MMLAYFKCKYGLHEPTAGTAEEPKQVSRQRRRAEAEPGAYPAAPRHRVGYPCQRPSCGGSGAIVVTGLVGEQDALAEQVGFRAAVHLSFEHLDAVDVAFDGAGAVGDGEPGGDGGPVAAESSGEAAQLADRVVLGLAGPGFEALAAAVAEHVRELADQGAGLL